MIDRITIRDIADMKLRGEKIPMVTAYDYVTARLADQVGMPSVLVGDSLGMVVLGYESTVQVTLDEMLHHIKAVCRGTRRALVVGDLPFMTYQIDPSQALRNATKIVQEGGAQAVKLEGGETIAETVRYIVERGIPVMGHIGLTPQSVNMLGGYRVFGKSMKEATQLLRDAKALQEAGAYSVVLELVPSPIAEIITQQLSIPTIGIGAGRYCDGQIQVLHDMLGLFKDFVPKHTKQFSTLGDATTQAFNDYMNEVRNDTFPTEKESVTIDQSVLEQFKAGLSSN